jgi:ABC-type oligopeptide transport system substrate-binding subunit
VRRLALSLALMAAGAALLASAARTGGTKNVGGVFRVGETGASVQIDPQLAYLSTAWWLEYATAAKLFDFPDRPGAGGNRLVPEVASGFSVSRDGRTWTFEIRSGRRFSDGSPVTAKSFAYAIDRAANHDLSSPAAAFITDANGTDIVGARAVHAGHATHVRGVAAHGNRLTIRLAKPDAGFLMKLTMPFFQATSAQLPLTREVASAYPSAGPYHFSGQRPNVLTELRRNPYYGGKRPRHLRGVEVRWNLKEMDAYQQVLANGLDEG